MSESTVGVRNRLNQDIIHFRIIIQQMKSGTLEITDEVIERMERVLSKLEQELTDWDTRHPG